MPLSLTFLIWNIPPEPVDWHTTGDEFSGVDVMIQSNKVHQKVQTLTQTLNVVFALVPLLVRGVL